ncbi:hypothetical protein TVAG_394960 [Trichomonas vaginalis G3]|uniref:Uncharacterized protein n=1 Tax=Trichomonas vaginalis (strain ATCC PRA-98 / G3) TaxID=412133 RepID=A2EDG0_TRIV3|nr:spectrin binding [Trichomonas vaginalis G3]EAY09324.1 hypothetical protein TVAG_394960 [Trichomonas vaginalis G3]KAI5510837.1 spectrin binding [Trichomonas vaginalis G3]|eukprot:XP_001321547.1 hypothetical protein [Trichomonas vaginalis G3]
MTEAKYNELMNLYQDFYDTCCAVYKLHTFNEVEINKIYFDIRNTIVETKIMSPYQTLTMIHLALTYNVKYFKSYKAIFKKVYDEYHPNLMHRYSIKFPSILWQDLSDEHGILLSERFSSEIEKMILKIIH